MLVSVFSDLLLYGEAAGLVTNDMSIGYEPPIPQTVDGKTTFVPNPKSKTDTQ